MCQPLTNTRTPLLDPSRAPRRNPRYPHPHIRSRGIYHSIRTARAPPSHHPPTMLSYVDGRLVGELELQPNPSHITLTVRARLHGVDVPFARAFAPRSRSGGDEMLQMVTAPGSETPARWVTVSSSTHEATPHLDIPVDEAVLGLAELAHTLGRPLSRTCVQVEVCVHYRTRKWFRHTRERHDVTELVLGARSPAPTPAAVEMAALADGMFVPAWRRVGGQMLGLQHVWMAALLVVTYDAALVGDVLPLPEHRLVELGLVDASVTVHADTEDVFVADILAQAKPVPISSPAFTTAINALSKTYLALYDMRLVVVADYSSSVTNRELAWGLPAKTHTEVFGLDKDMVGRVVAPAEPSPLSVFLDVETLVA